MIMFREDSKIYFAEEDVLPPAFALHSKIDNQCKMCSLAVTDDAYNQA